MAKVVINGQEVELTAEALTALLQQVAQSTDGKAVLRQVRTDAQVGLNAIAVQEAEVAKQKLAIIQVEVDKVHALLSEDVRRELGAIFQNIMELRKDSQCFVVLHAGPLTKVVGVKGSWDKPAKGLSGSGGSGGSEARSSAGSQRGKTKRTYGLSPQEAWDKYSVQHATAEELTDYATGDKNKMSPAKASLVARLISQGVLKPVA